MVVFFYMYSALAWLVSVTILCVGVFFSLVFKVESRSRGLGIVLFRGLEES